MSPRSIVYGQRECKHCLKNVIDPQKITFQTKIKTLPCKERVFGIDTMRAPYLAAAKVKSISKSS